MRLARTLWAGLILALVACRSPRDAPAPAASALPEAAPPSSLVAELSLGNPKETWRRLRVLGGDRAQALPSSLPVLLATSLSLPPAAAGGLDEALPMVGVILSRAERAEPDVVLGMHVVSGAELVASLTLGDGAKFRRVELGARVVRLVSAPGAPEFDGALGVSGNYLLLSTNVDALKDAARFVAEKVSKRARSEPGLTLSAGQSVLGGLLARRLREAWHAERARLSAQDLAARAEKGRAPDFADPAVLLSGADGTVESWLSVLESSRELSLSLSPEPDRLRAELRLTPAEEGSARALHRDLVVGSTAPLLELPADARAGLLLRGDARAGEGGLGAGLASLFGDRLSAAQATRLSGALDAFAKSRRGATVVGLVPAPAPALVVRCELSDAASFSQSLSDLLALIELPAVSGWLSATLGRPSVERTKTRAGAERAKLRFARAGSEALTLPKSLSVTWQPRGDVGVIVVSPEANLEPSAFDQGATLASRAWLARDPAAPPEQTALALYLDARLLAPGGPDEAPLWLNFGRKGDQTAFSLDLSAPALSALARRFALDRSP